MNCMYDSLYDRMGLKKRFVSNNRGQRHNGHFEFQAEVLLGSERTNKIWKTGRNPKSFSSFVSVAFSFVVS